VKSRNLHRRHLNASQRALAVVAGNEWRPTGQPKKAAPGAALTTEQLAAGSDTSERTIRQAKVVATQAAPEVVEAVKSGAMSLKTAVETTEPTVARPLPWQSSDLVIRSRQLMRRCTAWRRGWRSAPRRPMLGMPTRDHSRKPRCRAAVGWRV
jgi:hypothetical protein